MSMRRPGVTAALLVFLTAVLTGCGDDDTTVGGDDVSIAHPPGDDLVVQVRHVGGLRPANEAFSDLPAATLVGNGVLVFEGAQIEIFPPPMLPSLWRVDVDDEGVQAVLQRARDSGLLSSAPDYGHPPIADATTTVVEIHAQDQVYVHEVYALRHGDRAVAGLSPEQLERRERVVDFASILTAPEIELGSTLRDPDPYRADAMALRASAVNPGEEVEDAPGGMTTEVIEWPLPGVSLAQASDCVLIEGPETGQLYGVLEGASTATRFEQDGDLFTLQIRPLLPNEDSCGDAVAT
ncbi:MAG TPA: hypothetical protein VGV93_09975 [Acidimicrobiales bacterium]|nr:hypothetical protein [Acidimicrobiales bacterium]